MELTREQFVKKLWEFGNYEGEPELWHDMRTDLLAHDAALRTRLEAVEQERNEYIRQEGPSEGFYGRNCARLLDRIGAAKEDLVVTRQRLAQVEQDRDVWKQSAERHCEEHGHLARQLATAQVQLNSVSSGHHPRCTTVSYAEPGGTTRGPISVCHIDCKLQLSNVLGSQLEKAQARIKELEHALRLHLAVAPDDPILTEPHD